MAEPTPADIVAILNAETGEQVFGSARPLNASVYEAAKAMSHPLENGSAVIDHIVYDPIEIDFSLRVTTDPSAILAEIRELFRAGTLLTVQTRSGTYDDQFITALPTDERAERAAVVDIDLRLQQAVFLETQYAGAVAPVTRANTGSTPRRAQARASTENRGNQQTAPATPDNASRGSILYRTFGGGRGR